MRVDPALRAAKQAEWNQPIWWPLVLLVARARGWSLPAYRSWRRRERETAARTLAVAEGASAVPRRDAEPRVLNYIIRRIGYGVLILIGVNLLTFFLFFTVNTPDDMARLNIGGKRVTQEQIEKWKAERGYDKPLYWNAKAEGAAKLRDTIFWERSVSLFTLDFGRSDSARGDIGHEVAHPHVGQPAARGAAVHAAGDRRASPSRCCWCSSAIRSSISGASCCAC